jgi:hypothetical protein
VACGTRLSFSLKHNHLSSALKPNIYWQIGYQAYWAHITNIQSVRLILAHGGQPISPWPIQAGATTLEVPTYHITLPNLPNRRSSTFHLTAPHGLRLTNLNISLKWKWCKSLSPTYGLLTTRHLSKSIFTPSNYQCLPITSKVIKGNTEGIHNTTTVPVNSYQPNAQSLLT